MNALVYRVRLRRRLRRAEPSHVAQPHVAHPHVAQPHAGPVEALGRVLPLWRASSPSERGHRALGALAGALALGTNGHGLRALAGIVVGAWAGDRAARALLGRAHRAVRTQARAALPLVLDRLVTCVLAGMSIERALRTVAPSTPGLLGDALTEGLRAVDVGMPRAQAYARITARADVDQLRSVLAALERAERFGSSVVDTLVALAHEMRSRARAEAEAEARTAPLKMLFPLVLCFLPAFVLLTIAPVALSALRTLSQM